MKTLGWRRASVWAALVPVSLAAGASCGSSGDVSEAGRCENNQQCPPGQVCDVSASACVELADNSLFGSFECTVDPPPDDNGYTNVIGRLNGEDFSLSTGVVCYSDPDLPEVFFDIYMLGPADHGQPPMQLSLTLDFALDNPGVQELEAGDFPSARRFGNVYRKLPDGTYRVQGWVVGGAVGLLDEAESKARVRGWLKAELRVPPDSLMLSEACGSTADCGYDPTTRCGGIQDDNARFCFTECDDGPQVCGPGGVCIADTTSSGKQRKWCVKSCDGGCPGGVSCNASSGVQGCFQ